MGRKKLYTEEELKERRRLYNKKYRESEKGKEKYKTANLKYQKSDTYKNYKKEYYQKKKGIVIEVN